MERDRAAWARELHDETLQGLTAVRVRLSAARRRPREELAAEVDTAIDLLAKETAALRALLSRVGPPALGDLGLPHAFEGLAIHHASTTGLDVTLEWEPSEASLRLEPELENALFRIAQEALDNAVQHGEAETASIRVIRRPGLLLLAVRDDGAGFDAELEPRGLGLRSLEERIVLLGGSLEVSSTPGSGTSLRARVPLRG
jgi:signal transduction histidine kinase